MIVRGWRGLSSEPFNVVEDASVSVMLSCDEVEGLGDQSDRA